MIQAENLSLDLPSRSGQSRPILDKLSFHFLPSSFTIIHGESGSGKSSLLAILAACKRPSSGLLLLKAQPVSKFSAAFRDTFRQNIGFVPQHPLLFDNESLLNNVLIPTLPLSGTKKTYLSRATELLSSLDLLPLAHQKAKELSGGEQQRLAIARALINNPSIVLLDEPTAHQDDQRASQILSLLASQLDLGSTIVVATHDPRLCPTFPHGKFRLENGSLSEQLP